MRSDFITSTLNKVNQKYKINLQLNTDPTPGIIIYPRGTVPYKNIISPSTQDIYNWKTTSAQVQAALSEFYFELAKYDYANYVQDPTPSLNLSNPRNQFIRNLVISLQQKYGLVTLYYDRCYASGAFMMSIDSMDTPQLCISYEGRCLHNQLPQGQINVFQGIVNKTGLASKDFKADLAEYDANPPQPVMQYPTPPPGPTSTTPPPPVLPPGVPPGLPGVAPQPVAPFGPAAASYQPSTQALPVSVASAQPAFTPASFLSAYEIAAARSQEARPSSVGQGYLIAGASIDLSALRSPANLRSPYMQLGAECLISCIRTGFSKS